MTDGHLKGRTAVVTGASRGIGRAIASELRAAGATVVGTRTRDVGSTEGCDSWIAADFSLVEDIERCAAEVRQLAPDILVHNAGINRIAPFAKVQASEFLLIQQVNVFAPFRLCQAAVPAMQSRGWGRIVNLSSIWGKISKAQRASYSTSKFAIDGMTIALAAEHSSDGILANSVAPGFIDTEMTRTLLNEGEIAALVAQVPARRLGSTNDIAQLVLWLASDENRFVTGQNIAADGGFTRV